MRRLTQVTRAAAGALLLLTSVSNLAAQQLTTRAPETDSKSSTWQGGRGTYLKAFVVDDRLSALRREPDLRSEVVRRLRLGRTVFIVGASNPKTGQPRFCRVAVTRRTRGWLHPAALAVQGRGGEDQRMMRLIENASDGLDRILLCRILIERFSQSQLVPRALLLLGEEAERAAETLSQRARKRLAEVRGGTGSARLSEYYLNDAGLDRYSKLRVVFDFNEFIAEYVYDGGAYRDIVRRFPQGEEARLARQRLEFATQKMARRQ
ncbi:MAG: hypothetical protein AABO57_07645 [Acidobacteriota bacterium]